MAGACASIRLAVFDLMGTTVRDDGAVARAFGSALERAGIPVSGGQLSAVRGMSKREAVRQLVEGQRRGGGHSPGSDELDELCRRVHADFQDILLELWRSRGVEAVPGAVQALQELRLGGVLTALNTGLDRRVAEALLGLLPDLERTAGAVVCGDQVARGRPAPDLMLRCMAFAGVEDPALVLNVGDTAADMEAGAAAGVGVNVAVTSGAHGRERLLRSPCTHLLPSAAGVPALLGGPATG
jgi:phosphonatase-like hydrolase